MGLGEEPNIRRRRNLFFYKILYAVKHTCIIEAGGLVLSRLFDTFVVKLMKRFEPLSADTIFVY
jgi:hypothetical protein